MPDTPVDLGFAELIAKLISDTFSAVAESAMEQERRQGEFAAAASLTLEEFADTYIEDDDVEAEMQQRFPPSADGEPSSAAAGQPYIRATDDDPESPPLLAELGIAVARGDVSRRNGDERITGRLERRIRQAIALELGRQAWQLARAVVARGMPRVLVDSGHVLAKLTYTLERLDQPEREEEERELRFRRLRPVFRPVVRPDITLRVSTPRSTEPAARADIYGEVEITFKTVP